ncbi:DUF551 domain-containing protein [Klebsiella pneumoniae]|nr:DUF551 domain-containing protein [Klebsiella pneumoniae]OVV55690.1 hypothetical protein BME67_28625 [Klebsiella pneumoniae]OVV67662.1 hypothetical protein BME68_03075 [Klebsiella pneumoniae]OVV74181.1 hypothetical protein BME66_03950 [Klebsiella pneumoniae]OVV86148.1 hypothetical protein BME64_07800 [Klebsiella pneumoniae]
MENKTMTKSTITRERIQRIIRAIDSEAYDEEEIREWLSSDEIMELARMALAAMDSESWCLPLDYLQGHKDGLEWAAQLAEANHHETGDWLYDDPIELAKAIRKGPDMPPAQPVADSEPVIVVGDDGGDALSYRRLIQSFEPGTKLYRHAQPVPAVPGKWIPVSEQMPEVGVKVLCFPVKDEPIHATFNGQLWLQDISWSGSDEPIDNVIPTSVTHWMPLPAAPQEVRGE